MKPVHYTICIVGSFVLATLFASGVLLEGDAMGRALIAGLWTIVGIGWTLRLATSKGRAVVGRDQNDTVGDVEG